ncbi:MAG: alpha-galactosidase, partial [Candidatus Hydrogenedentes bacterium]|nr:alpha-galactosidase [Candidatus Hydrogenedentota bacterium]
QVRGLFPWCVGDMKDGQFTLGPGTEDALVFDNGLVWNRDIAPAPESVAPEEAAPPAPGRTEPSIAVGDALSDWSLAVYNPQTNRSLVAGFLTFERGFTRIRLERPLGKRSADSPSEPYPLFRAECIFDPPVTLEPGERLLSEVFYIAVAEDDVLEGLARYGHAVAVANEIPRLAQSGPPLARGWISLCGEDVSEDAVLQNVNAVGDLTRYGWSHVHIDGNWQAVKGDWEPDPARFPQGMKWLTEQIHARGMTAGLQIDPFTVAAGSSLAQAHPDWLAASGETSPVSLGEDERLLDITVPEAAEHVKALCARITGEWGFDAVELAPSAAALLYAESFDDTTVTRVEAYRTGLDTVRTGLGDAAFRMDGPPRAVTGLFADGMRLGRPTAPAWRAPAGGTAWGAVEALENAARWYYYTPYLWAPDPGYAYFGHDTARARWALSAEAPLTAEQARTWLTGAALTGGVIRLGDRVSELTPPERAVLRRLLPPLPRPARPVDLFTGETPRIWAVPIRTPIGEWTIMALFNWDEHEAKQITVSFEDLGLKPGAYYTVFGFWEDTYYGTASGSLSVNVGPGCVGVIGLRPYENHPMFLSTDRHLSQGATDCTALEWDAQARRLHGTFEGVADTDYNLRVLVPPPYEAGAVTVSTGPATTAVDGNVLKIGLHCAEAGPVDWAVQF